MAMACRLLRKARWGTQNTGGCFKLEPAGADRWRDTRLDFTRLDIAKGVDAMDHGEIAAGQKGMGG